MLTFGHRLATLVLAAALAAGQAGVCAGWAPTAEARMACCADERSCPMHPPDSAEAGTARVLTQADADRCCAASEGNDSSSSPSGGMAATFAAVLAPLPALLHEPRPHEHSRRTLVPKPIRHVPKHVLLSVFLV